MKNAKFSGYHFYINMNTLGDFQICISVPLSNTNLVFNFDITHGALVSQGQQKDAVTTALAAVICSLLQTLLE